MAIFNIPTLAEQVVTVRNRLLANNKNINTLPGSVAGDLFILPQAESDVQQLAISYYVSISKSIPQLIALKSQESILNLLASALNTTTDAILTDISLSLDELGSNFSLTRASATAATGIVWYVRPTAPIADIVVNTGSLVQSSSGAQYEVLADVVMYAPTISSSGTPYNPTLGGYAVPASVRAVEAGSAGNASKFTIQNLLTPVNGISEVANIDPITGGYDAETDESFAARIQASWQAVGKLTKAGIVQTIQNAYPGTAVYVASPDDPINARGFGKTDVYVRGPIQQTTVSEIFSFLNSTVYVTDGVRPSYQPVVSVEQTVPPTSVFLQPDVVSTLANSVQAQDTIRFTTDYPGSLTLPSVTITYIVNSFLTNVQNLFNSPENAPLNQQNPLTLTGVDADVSVRRAIETPILIKAATPVGIDYAVSITVLPGQLKSAVISQVIQNLNNYVNSAGLGSTLYLGDLNEVVEQTPGVLRISGSPTKFSISTQTGIKNSITVANNQYAILSSVAIS